MTYISIFFHATRYIFIVFQRPASPSTDEEQEITEPTGEQR